MHHHNINQSGLFRLWQRLHLDGPLLLLLFTLACIGMLVLYSASGQSMTLMLHQAIHFLIAFITLFLLAQIPPHVYARWAPVLYVIATSMLFAVLIMGHIGKGAQRWLDLKVIRFQPSELAKIAIPLALAWYFSQKRLPPKKRELLAAAIMLMIPVLLIAKQPDLGTALMVACAGIVVIFFAGISWRIIVGFLIASVASLPVLWHYLHDYQRERVLTFLNPERDPLGSGYHIIQSKIAIGSGGIVGKGWLNGSQGHLHFLPEHATDFIFALVGEEFGLLGGIILITLYACIIARCIYISLNAQDTFSRLATASLSLLFFLSMFVNMGMVTGILPVVGIPLPLISYGGTSLVTFVASFGILMSVHTHRKLVSS